MKNFCFIAILITAVLYSCKKDKDTDPGGDTPAVTKRLTKFSYENNAYPPETYEYDASGRVVKHDDGEDVATIVYSGNTVNITINRKSEARQVFKVSGTLNSAGNLIEINGIASYQANTPARPIQISYEYNVNGYMSRRILSYDNGADVYEYRYTYVGSNLKDIKSYRNDVYQFGGDYEYDLSTSDRSGLTWDRFDFGNKFTGKPNKNLPNKYIGHRPDGSFWTADFKYTFDADGYPATVTTTVDGNSQKYLYHFE